MRVRVLVLVVLFFSNAASADPRVLWLRNTHTHEELRIRPFQRLGIPSRLAWRRLTRFFRSATTGKRRTVHPRLLRVLAQVQRHFGGRRLELVSGYRVPGEGKEMDSYHHVARAADVRIDGVANRRLFDYCQKMSAGGVFDPPAGPPRAAERRDSPPRARDGGGAALGCGYYPNGNHVHIDVRSQPGIWVDLGDRNYVDDPMGWLNRHPPE